MKVVDLDLNFKTCIRSPYFDIYSLSYNQISGQMSNLDKNIISAFKQNLKFLDVELSFGFNMKVVELFLSF